VNDRRDLSPDVDFSAAAKIGAHDRADEMEEKPSLDLLRRLEPIEAGLMEPKAGKPACPMIEAFPRRLHMA
jgi:hypothetical protein